MFLTTRIGSTNRHMLLWVSGQMATDKRPLTAGSPLQTISHRWNDGDVLPSQTRSWYWRN